MYVYVNFLCTSCPFMKNILNKRNGIEMRLISFRVRPIIIHNIYLLVLILYFLTFKTHTPTFKFLEFFSSQISSLTIQIIHTMIEDIFSSWLTILSTCSIFNCPSLGVMGSKDSILGRTYFLSSFSFLCTFSTEVFEFQKWSRTRQLSL